ncbi:MAG: hypothetical protein KIT58_00735 [Planctomycetota bacterium]|nr:hypothetical protein [Planctomycetota bacterium]
MSATMHDTTYEAWLWDLARRAEPGASRVAAASKSQNLLRRRVIDSGLGLDSYLSGSYSRRTAIWPLDDVDVVVLIDPSRWDVSWWSGMPSSIAVLNSFARGVRKLYQPSGTRVFMQRRSVRLALSHLDIDVVPGVPTNDDPSVIQIPDRDADQWITTSPLRHKDLSEQLNAHHDGLFKPLVKLLKLWNSNLPSTARFKSFCVETIAVRLFSDAPLSSLADGIWMFLDFVAWLGDEESKVRWSDARDMSLTYWNCVVPDSAETGGNTAAGVDDARRSNFVARAVTSRDLMLRAAGARSTKNMSSALTQAFRLPRPQTRNR